MNTQYTIQYTIFVSKPSASVPQNCRSQKGQKGPRAPELDHSRRPIGKSRMHFPYLSSSPIVPAAQQTLCKASAEDIIDTQWPEYSVPSHGERWNYFRNVHAPGLGVCTTVTAKLWRLPHWKKARFCWESRKCLNYLIRIRCCLIHAGKSSKLSHLPSLQWGFTILRLRWNVDPMWQVCKIEDAIMFSIM